ncbi:hypothetical protein HR10_03025, partial [Porphyromonas gulae]
MPNDKTSKNNCLIEQKPKHLTILSSDLFSHLTTYFLPLKERGENKRRVVGLFSLKFYFVTMYQPAIDPNLDNDIRIIRAVTMMGYQSYIKVVKATQVDILGILAGKD